MGSCCSITWETVKNSIPQALGQTSRMRNSGVGPGQLCFHKPFGCLLMLKLENHWMKQKTGTYRLSQACRCFCLACTALENFAIRCQHLKSWRFLHKISDFQFLHWPEWSSSRPLRKSRGSFAPVVLHLASFAHFLYLPSPCGTPVTEQFIYGGCWMSLNRSPTCTDEEAESMVAWLPVTTKSKPRARWYDSGTCSLESTEAKGSAHGSSASHSPLSCQPSPGV